MHETIEQEETATVDELWSSVISRVCGYIPPLWDLGNYVAVNPFLGFADRTVSEAARFVTDGLGTTTLPSVAFYRKQWETGAFDEAALNEAAQRLDVEPSPLKKILTTGVVPTRPASVVLTFAERIDREQGTHWSDALIRSITRWCAVYTSGGGSWKFPSGQGLFSSWREAESVDRTLEIAGLKGLRRWVRQLPDSADVATEQILNRLNLPADERELYLYRLLGGVFGWAAFFKRSSWEMGRSDGGQLADLLAIRVCADAAVAEVATRNRLRRSLPPAPAIEDEATRCVFQEALEDGYASRLLRAINPPPTDQTVARPTVQSVFCIDVRSEPFRRHLEAQSDTIQTKGFAGFFGVSLDWQTDGEHSARCPVLLKPSLRLCSSRDGGPSFGMDSVKYLQTAPAASFSFVETLGAAYGIGLASDALAAMPARASREGTDPFTLDGQPEGMGIDEESRVNLASGILTNLGLRTGFSRLILFCGHEGHSTNNPHAAGLDCGACGGHGGSINARIAAALLNEPAVREGVRVKGINIPADVWFIAGVHDTSVDQVSIHDADKIPASHTADVDRLQEWLNMAGEATRAERATALGLPATATNLKPLLKRRSRDWSEVRPEWGLARNAAFIAARRLRTRGVNLAGRTFLHDYDCATDPDNSVLTLILTAPMIVASWINLQYFGSTVDNDVFGSGDKALHNRVGTIGVVLGNGGDLRTGLPKQSVHAADGTWFHEPLRLQVVVEAPTKKIDQVVNAQVGVRNLIDNGWVRLFALDPESMQSFRRNPSGMWEIC